MEAVRADMTFSGYCSSVQTNTAEPPKKVTWSKLGRKKIDEPTQTPNAVTVNEAVGSLGEVSSAHVGT